ncbi:hypothetical protein IY145_15670 [Methylosinus sp. H3A]|uniref:hypothetical protein n=1 Tax=Methylosinus sp. H3A TaxID=2785786 RepID=UPI0018C23106|nr:hypothetical protein [Methylosinus sp. H3A]MBG0810810.1 hypothetical protein [Methylosinus sp. H3A]
MDIGYSSDRPICLFATGELRVPLEQTIPLAIALEIEPGALFSAVLGSYMPLHPGLQITFDPKYAARRDARISPCMEVGDDPSSTIESEDATGAVPSAGRPAPVDMNFKVSSDFHRRFKGEAVQRGMSMKELLETCFETFLRSNDAAER